MAIQTQPTRIQIPFADSGTKNVIPDTNSTPSASQAASWTDGFPAQCSLPLSAGGIPPARADFNGIFNTMTQSERFTQEGGIWAWDADVDYAANRVVLGSDNKLYWAVAQSGPNVGGAQNPTTDNGTYWSAVQSAAAALIDSSSSVATTKWVKDLALVSVYVDAANGADANDGLTAGSPMKTLQAALARALQFASAGGCNARIIAAGGSYTGGLNLDGARVELVLQANVSVTGNLTVQNSGYLIVNGSYSLTVTGKTSITKQSSLTFAGASYTGNGLFELYSSSSAYFANAVSLSNSTLVLEVSGSSLYCQTTLSITSSGTGGVVDITNNGIIFVAQTLSIASDNATSAILSLTRSSTISASLFTVSGSGNTAGIVVARGNSTLLFTNGFVFGDCITSGAGISISESVMTTGGSSELYSSGASGTMAVAIADSSCFVLYGTSSSLTINAKSGVGALLYVSGCSAFESPGSLTLSADGTVSHGINCSYCSSVKVTNISISGTYSRIIGCYYSSSLSISPSGTVSGSPTGQRFVVQTTSNISVGGLGVNRIPGTVAGEAQSSSYAFYY